MLNVNGNEYEDLQHIAKIYAIPVSTILARLDQGLSLEDAIKKPQWSHSPVTVDGKNFPSIASAARHFGIDPKTVRSRLGHGWTIEEAFELKARQKKIASHNNKGKEVTVKNVKYKSIKEAALAHNADPRFIANRVKKGLTIEQALEIEPFPEWFVAGKGQFMAAKGQKAKESKMLLEKQTGSRICSCCKKAKPLSEFHGKDENKSQKCQHCISAAFLRYRYNISLTQFMEMRKSQSDKCKICSIDLEIEKDSSLRSKRVAIDHCHESGKVRGILCSNCNLGLGYFKDNISSLNNAIEYLASFQAMTDSEE